MPTRTWRRARRLGLLAYSKRFFAKIAEAKGETKETETMAEASSRRAEREEDVESSGDSEENYDFIVSVTKRGAWSTSHRKGGCWRAKKAAFASYELVEGPEPLPGFYNRKCRDCWKRTGSPGASEEDLSPGSSGSPTSSTSRS